MVDFVEESAFEFQVGGAQRPDVQRVESGDAFVTGGVDTHVERQSVSCENDEIHLFLKKKKGGKKSKSWKDGKIKFGFLDEESSKNWMTSPPPLIWPNIETRGVSDFFNFESS